MANTPVAGLPVGSTPSVSNADLTVSTLLKSPRIIEARLGELFPEVYFIDKILPNIGGVTESGVVVYEEWTEAFAHLDRKAERIAPDAEVPLAGSSEGVIKLVEAETDGLGYVVTDKQERRNMRHVVDRKERGLAFEIADKFNRRGVATMNAAIVAHSRTFATTDWSALVTEGANPDPKYMWPHSQIALVQANARQSRHPFELDGMLAHPLDVWRLRTIYQMDGLSDLAAKLKLPAGIIEDNTGDVARGTPILYSSGNTGGTVWEDPIKTEVVPERRRTRKVVQTTGSAGFFVDNPFGLLKLTGAADQDLA